MVNLKLRITRASLDSVGVLKGFFAHRQDWLFQMIRGCQIVVATFGQLIHVNALVLECLINDTHGALLLYPEPRPQPKI